MTRRVVLVESPYSGQGLEAIRYLSCCLLDSVLRGECPIASHAILPLCLPEHIEAYGGKTGREIGLECRDAMASLYEDTENINRACVNCVRYVDFGTSDGMRRFGIWLIDRQLEGEAKRIWEAGEWPSKVRWTATND